MALNIGPCVRCGSKGTGQLYEHWGLRKEGWFCGACLPAPEGGATDMSYMGRLVLDSQFGYPLGCWLCELAIPNDQPAFVYWDVFDEKMVLNCKSCHENPERISMRP